LEVRAGGTIVRAETPTTHPGKGALPGMNGRRLLLFTLLPARATHGMGLD
jgi:hypothetical protein